MIREFIGFSLFMFALLYGAPWMYYILTGNMMEF